MFHMQMARAVYQFTPASACSFPPQIPTNASGTSGGNTKEGRGCRLSRSPRQKWWMLRKEERDLWILVEEKEWRLNSFCTLSLYEWGAHSVQLQPWQTMEGVPGRQGSAWQMFEGHYADMLVMYSHMHCHENWILREKEDVEYRSIWIMVLFKYTHFFSFFLGKIWWSDFGEAWWWQRSRQHNQEKKAEMRLVK